MTVIRMGELTSAIHTAVGASSLYQKVTQRGSKVSLTTLLTKGCRSEDFIEVKVVHSFVVVQKSYVESHFLLADHEAHVSAILYTLRTTSDHGNENAPELYTRLKEGLCFRIRHFEIHRPRCRILLRNQSMRLKLRNSLGVYEEISENPQFPYLKHVPFSFISIENVKGDLHHKKLIDLVAYVKSVETKRDRSGRVYQVVWLVNISPNCPSSGKSEKCLRMALFGHNITSSLKVASLYALCNIFVKNDGMYGLSLSASASSAVIIEITRDILEKVYSGGSFEDLIMDDTDKQDAIFSGESVWNDDFDEVLCRVLSQVTLESENTCQQQTVPAQAPGSVVCEENPNCINACKRTLSMTSEPTPKKMRQTLCYEEVVDTSVDQDSSETETPLMFYDWTEKTSPLPVVVKKAKSYKDTHSNYYSMRSKIRGVLLIINNTFSDGSSKERRGSEVDVIYLTNFFDQCGFKVYVNNDVSSYDLRSKITEFKDEIEAIGVDNFDSLIIAVLSHGVHGLVEMADGVYIPLYDDIVHQFDEYNYPILSGKPKLFIVQACQNLPTLSDIQLARAAFTPPERTKMQNIIVCTGGSPGKFAYRDIYLGSYFVHILVLQLMLHSHDCHFTKILEKTQKAMYKVKTNRTDEFTCCWSSFGFKKLYFNPGL